MLKIDPLGPHVPNHSISYRVFFIRYKHKFLRNLYSNKEIAESPQIFTLEKYYETYQMIIKIWVGLLSLTSNVHTQGDFFDVNVRNFLDEKYQDITINELRSKIDKIEIRNLIKETVGSQKIPKFNLKIYAFVYDSLIDFPTSSDIMFDTITTKTFFKNVQKIIKVMVHLHHLQ